MHMYGQIHVYNVDVVTSTLFSVLAPLLNLLVFCKDTCSLLYICTCACTHCIHKCLCTFCKCMSFSWTVVWREARSYEAWWSRASLTHCVLTSGCGSLERKNARANKPLRTQTSWKPAPTTSSWLQNKLKKYCNYTKVYTFYADEGLRVLTVL